MTFNTNNNGILRLEQYTTDGDIFVTRNENGAAERIEKITAGDTDGNILRKYVMRKY